jgi:hypothetical protein
MAFVVCCIAEGASDTECTIRSLPQTQCCVLAKTEYLLKCFVQDNTVLVGVVSLCMSGLALAALRRVKRGGNQRSEFTLRRYCF